MRLVQLQQQHQPAGFAAQAEVHQRQVGFVFARRGQRLARRAGFGHHFEAVGFLQQAAEALAHHGVVIDEQDAWHSYSLAKPSAATARKIPSGAVSAPLS